MVDNKANALTVLAGVELDAAVVLRQRAGFVATALCRQGRPERQRGRGERGHRRAPADARLVDPLKLRIAPAVRHEQRVELREHLVCHPRIVVVRAGGHEGLAQT